MLSTLVEAMARFFKVASGFQCVRLDAIFESGLDAACEFASSAIGSKGV